MKVSIIGATGYTGEELLRILAGHPAVEILYITSESRTGTQINEIYPHFTRFHDGILASVQEIDKIAAESQAVFIGLPHGHAMEVGKKVRAVNPKIKIIDLGADYRFRNADLYEKWYKVPHTHREAQAVYGLTELYRSRVREAEIVGNPGCYTTASILALAPLVVSKLIDLATIVVDAKSGVSGAGRGLNLGSHFAEVFESVKAYSIAGHRHTPEIEQTLGELAGTDVIISFTPHLIPMTRGILSTCYASLKPGVSAEAVDAAFTAMYDNEYFIRLLGRGGYPATKNTRGSNFCDIGWHIDPRTGRVIVVAAIDNLVKGAAGQAVQNLNVMFGLDEQMGLTQVPLYP
ncbi:MAG TPA: N-acetyl-gamma-glutamyl-phosphate reductase [Methylomusa anaerophila]|uniref:N-acetyl-gamma-glutamyl-phosphate reductase n=1 Tax=Methylomusa anaerophila TaxID=1930071 RepID=A0A348AK16_9FIRM|nr:N-acetyl-gamma-glutamyl-phosphate reductase [Methylomusa anaerophila]BBB91414.1 N-acetyl-gamma-glutamyl-phosphate reductase [Methylomusa anaerophila]HML90161.1 N-acetyl-gamma-glutamyl-phosphate reductase [Methylomusa anaerophila]